MGTLNRNTDSVEDVDWEQYQKQGWLKFNLDKEILDWAKWTLPYAVHSLSAPEHQQWWRYQRTWFVGVNVLENDVNGSIVGGPKLSGRCVDFMRRFLKVSARDLDAAQVSAIFPGYPLPSVDEKEPGYAFRKQRDAAHVDGLLKLGEKGERFAREYHQYILAIPLTEVSELASPLVLWSGSHILMRSQLRDFYGPLSKSDWPDVPVNAVYEQTRRQVFLENERVEVPLSVGEALLIDRHLLHGTSVWRSDDRNDDTGRLIAFFRPHCNNMTEWLG